jgi:hypothetical protein
MYIVVTGVYTDGSAVLEITNNRQKQEKNSQDLLQISISRLVYLL